VLGYISSRPCPLCTSTVFELLVAHLKVFLLNFFGIYKQRNCKIRSRSAIDRTDALVSERKRPRPCLTRRELDLTGPSNPAASIKRVRLRASSPRRYGPTVQPPPPPPQPLLVDLQLEIVARSDDVRCAATSKALRRAILEPALPDISALPSVIDTRRRPKYTRQNVCQVLHLANSTRQLFTRQRALCRVFCVEHSAKKLPCVYLDTRQRIFE